MQIPSGWCGAASVAALSLALVHPSVRPALGAPGDAAAVLQLDEPVGEPAFVPERVAWIRGRVSRADAVLLVDGRRATLGATGSFEWPVELPALGEAGVRLEVTDRQGSPLGSRTLRVRTAPVGAPWRTALMETEALLKGGDPRALSEALARAEAADLKYAQIGPAALAMVRRWKSPPEITLDAPAELEQIAEPSTICRGRVRGLHEDERVFVLGKEVAVREGRFEVLVAHAEPGALRIGAEVRWGAAVHARADRQVWFLGEQEPERPPAPDFTVRDLEGKPWRLKDLLGSIVVLEWTSLRCPWPKARYEAGLMQPIVKDARAHGVVWLRVHSKAMEAAAQRKGWEERLAAWDSPVDALLVDRDQQLATAYSIKHTIAAVVIDRRGRIAYDGAYDDATNIRDSGAPALKNTHSWLRDAIEAVRTGSPVRVRSTGTFG